MSELPVTDPTRLTLLGDLERLQAELAAANAELKRCIEDAGGQVPPGPGPLDPPADVCALLKRQLRDLNAKLRRLQRELTGKDRDPPPRPKPDVVREIKRVQAALKAANATLRLLGC
ncbi:MAG: hypothetical protein M3340_02630 [Actinomycetota bacterium]|nr:hypothetical protein [Actinomycetota bacterium]